MTAPNDWRLQRLEQDDEAMLGELRAPDGKHVCYTLENRWRNNQRRVSCIPAGRYRLVLRTHGGWNQRLAGFYPDIHEGALELSGVPNRDAILIHPGNFHGDTQGCILPGRTRTVHGGHFAVLQSGDAYRAIYPPLAAHARAGGYLHVLDPRDISHSGTAV